MTLEMLEKRIAELKTELEQLVIEANRQIGMKQGALAELERLRASLTEAATES